MQIQGIDKAVAHYVPMAAAAAAMDERTRFQIQCDRLKLQRQVVLSYFTPWLEADYAYEQDRFGVVEPIGVHLGGVWLPVNDCMTPERIESVRRDNTAVLEDIGELERLQ